MLHMHCNIPCMFDHWAGPAVHLLQLKSSMVESIDKHTHFFLIQNLPSSFSFTNALNLFYRLFVSLPVYTSNNITSFFPMCAAERWNIYRESILEHFLPISKQTPKPSASIEYQDVVYFEKSKHSESNEMGQANLRPQISTNDACSIYSISLVCCTLFLLQVQSFSDANVINKFYYTQCSISAYMSREKQLEVQTQMML